MADTVSFNQILYKQDHAAELFPFGRAILNHKIDAFFENSIIARTVPWLFEDKIAVCSWALRRKMTTRIPPRRDLTEDVLQEDFDVMAFTKNSPGHDMIGALDYFHPGSVDVMRKIFAALGTGLQVPANVKNPIYQNAFCARRDVYHAYVRDFLQPAIEVMNNDEEIRKLLWVDSGYRVTTLNIPIDFNFIEQQLGVRFYPLHAFILERCFSCWINDKSLKIIHL